MARIEALCKDFLSHLECLDGNLRCYRHLPKTPDCQVIGLDLATLLDKQITENGLYCHLKHNHPALYHLLPARQRYNAHIKSLRGFADQLAASISDALLEPAEAVLVDSTPLPAVKFTRANRFRICREQLDFLPAFGYGSSQKGGYMGYKLDGKRYAPSGRQPKGLGAKLPGFCGK